MWGPRDSHVLTHRAGALESKPAPTFYRRETEVVGREEASEAEFTAEPGFRNLPSRIESLIRGLTPLACTTFSIPCGSVALVSFLLFQAWASISSLSCPSHLSVLAPLRLVSFPPDFQAAGIITKLPINPCPNAGGAGRRGSNSETVLVCLGDRWWES